MRLDDVIRFEDGGEDWEAVPVVQLGGVRVAIDTCDFDFFAGFGAVDEVPEEDYLAVSGEAACRDRAGGFLEGEFLIIAVDCFFRVECEGPS